MIVTDDNKALLNIIYYNYNYVDRPDQKISFPDYSREFTRLHNAYEDWRSIESPSATSSLDSY